MKILSKLIIVMLALVSFGANAQKLGHINSQELLQIMPEYKKADTAAQTYQKSLVDEDNSMVTEYQSKKADYDKNKASFPDAVKAVKEQELQDMVTRIQKYEGGAQDQLQSKKQEIFAPVLKKASDAVKEVAKENGYAYVFDTSIGAVIYSQDSDDIMPLVKKKLGLK
jgi:outer membrane protein